MQACESLLAVSSSYISYANTLLVFGALVVAAITIGLTYYFSRDKQKTMQEMTQNFLKSLANDEHMREELINKILTHSSFKKELERIITTAKQSQSTPTEKTKKEKLQ